MPSTPFQPPAVRGGLLPRPRLVEALATHVDRRLQCVIAPAGFGKSSLLAAFAREVELPVCWVSLGPLHEDLAGFLGALIAALRTHLPELGGRTAAMIAASEDLERATAALARSLVTEIEETATEPVLLILDDFHEVNESAPITAFLSHLLRVLPDSLRVLLGSRAAPNLPLAQLTVEDELHSLDAADLRFTEAELRALVEQRGLEDLPPERVTELAVRSEGWVAGFLLALARLRAARTGDAPHPAGGEGLVYDYLAGEVFERQPAEVQRFLLASSVPASADPEICRVLLGPGPWEETARSVLATGLFVSRDQGSDGALRYHQLFREFLQARLRRVAPDDYRRLHIQAGEHLAAQGDWQSALAHFREAGAEAEAVQLVARVVPELEGRFRWRAIDGAVRGLNLDQLGGYPQVLLAAAWAAQKLEDFPRAVALAERARAAGAQSGDRGVEARALARLGMIEVRRGRLPEAAALLEEARGLAPDDGELAATVQFYQGQILGTTGDLGGAASLFHDALVYFDESGPATRAADAEHALALALDFTGRLPEAAARYASARDRWRRLGNVEFEAMELTALGDLLTRQGEYQRAQRALTEALALVRAAGSPMTEAGVLRVTGWYRLSVGEPAAAAEAFEQGLLIARDLDDLRRQFQMLDGLALALAMEGDLGRAEGAAHQAVALAQRREERLLAAITSLALGAVQARMGRREALATLEQAAETLAGVQAGWQLARAQTWLAQAAFSLGKRRDAFEHLRTALALARAYGSEAVFDLHVHWDRSLFEAARAAGIEPERLERLLARVSARSPEQARPAAHQIERWDIRGFGPGIVTLGSGQPIVWKRDKSRELLFLLLQLGPQRTEQLIEMLWPESPPARAHPRLHMAVSHLREAIHPRPVLRASGMYQLGQEAPLRYDVAEFEALLRQAAGAGAEAAVPLLQQACALYRAPFLGDTSTAWAEAERDRLERLYLGALTRLAELHEAAGQHHESIAAAEQLLQTDPYREDAHAQIIRAHLRLGNQAGAVRHFMRCARLLRDDLGVEPGPELRSLLVQAQR